MINKSSKRKLNPGTLLSPLPPVMVSCGSTKENYNIITIAWTGIINSKPPMVSISIRKTRHSYEIIKKEKEFVINLTTKKLAYATDWCGVKSGKDLDKFKEMNLTPTKGQIVQSPIIEESPVSLECKVKEIKEMGSHDMFIADIVAVNASEEYFDTETDEFQLFKARPITYSHGHYYEVGKHIGKFGFSVMKDKTKKRLAQRIKKR